ncbi:unnamed protein product [Callosobruchus maculatus]|uniref:BRISC and BRCA1-A complex member 2 n=1 Tax=Callosobruchus maculatus TaxID=64391 RepID=A0A653CP54_CALMS|nr:unnamed protein product [Callosobruchus maculatus]
MGISPCLKKHFDELCLNSCLDKPCFSGLSSISYNDITPYNSADFIIKVPYAGKKLKWDILFDPDDFTFPPDFDFNDDCFLADPDLEILEQNAPSLENWNLDNPKMLAIILNEFLEYYKKLQIEKLKIENIYSRYYEEYEDLISGDHIKPEDVQVSVDSSNMIIFLIEIKLDLTALIEYCNDLELLDLDSNIQLKITINKMDGSNTKSYIQYPPQMEHLFGDHPALPKFGKEVPIKEYVAAVNEMLTQKISHITEGCSFRCAGECAKWFHKKCTGLTNDQFLAYEKRTCDEKWMCSKCIETIEGSESEPEDSETCSMKNPSNKDILKAMNRRFTDLEHAITFNGEIMEELKNTIKVLTEENKNIKKEHEKLKGRVNELEKQVNIMQKKMDKEELEGRRKNIVITGLRGDRNASKNVKKVPTRLNVEENEMEDCKISVLPSTDTNKSIIVVKFNNEDLRNRVLEKRKGIFLDSENCNIDDLKTRLFINEDLSRPTRELFKKARELRQKGYKYVWCKNEQVYVRKKEGEQAVRISSLADVQQLLLRKEFIRSIYALCRSYTVEVDTKHFTRIIILAKHQEYSCLVTIIAGNKFPQEKPIIKLSSIYCQEGKSCNKILPKYQYNTALGPDKNAYNLVKSLPQLICQMKQHKC